MIKKINITVLILILTVAGLQAHDFEFPDMSNFERDTIVIASEPDYTPYCYVDKHGQPAGFAVDLFIAAANAVNLDVIIKIGLWNEIKQDLVDNKIDALPFVGQTPERKDIYDFTLSYISLHGAVFVKKGTKNIQSPDDLKDKNILVMKGDNAEEFVRREHISDNIETTNTYGEAFKSLSQGNHDAVITQRAIGLNLLKQLHIKNVVALDMHLPEFREDFSFAVKKGNTDLLDKLNEGLSIVIANGTYNMIREKWLGSEEKFEVSFVRALQISLFVTISLFVAFAIIMMFALRRQIKRKTRDLKSEIREHKETLESLRQKNILLNEMEKISLIGAWEYDMGEKAVKWSSGVYNIYDVDPEIYDPGSYKEDISFFSNKDQVTLDHSFNKAIQDGTSYDLELQLITPKGEKKWVRTRGQTEFKDGKIIRVFGNIQDITEIKKINQNLKDREEHIRLLMNSTAEGILGIDTEGNCTFCNMAAMKMLGYLNAKDVIGKNILKLNYHSFADGSPRPYDQCEICGVMKSGKGAHAETDILWHLNGTYFNAEIFSYPIIEKNKIQGAVVTFFNVDARKKAQDELNQLKENLEKEIKERTYELNKKVETLDKSQKAMLYMVEDLNNITAELKNKRLQLESANKELEAFAYSVSHDLRAPLRAIDGFSNFLYEDYAHLFDDEGRRLIGVIRTNTQKMDRLITDILNLSRISRTQMDISEIDMSEMAKNTFREIASKEEQKQFTFKVGRLPKVMADPALIRQVWQNLIENALKYSSKSDIKEITINAKKEKDKIVFLVRDKGAGFNPRYAHKLFGVFQRLHAEEEFGGTGIGLAIVQRIINRHGGSVSAEGNINKGATFSFSLKKAEKTI